MCADKSCLGSARSEIGLERGTIARAFFVRAATAQRCPEADKIMGMGAIRLNFIANGTMNVLIVAVTLEGE